MLLFEIQTRSSWGTCCFLHEDGGPRIIPDIRGRGIRLRGGLSAWLHLGIALKLMGRLLLHLSSRTRVSPSLRVRTLRVVVDGLGGFLLQSLAWF